MSNDGLTKFIKDLNDDLEYLDNQYGYKTQICTKEELERDARFSAYCQISFRDGSKRKRKS